MTDIFTAADDLFSGEILPVFHSSDENFNEGNLLRYILGVK
jgi:hypothetical protein